MSQLARISCSVGSKMGCINLNVDPTFPFYFYTRYRPVLRRIATVHTVAGKWRDRKRPPMQLHRRPKVMCVCVNCGASPANWWVFFSCHSHSSFLICFCSFCRRGNPSSQLNSVSSAESKERPSRGPHPHIGRPAFAG